MIAKRAISVLVLLALADARTADAGGFFLRGYGTQTLGVAFAGQSVGYHTSTVATNPAGMTQFHGLEASAGAGLGLSTRRFDGSGRSALGVPTGVDTGGNSGGAFVLGAAFAIYEIDPAWRVGIGFYSPFGLSSEWNDGWVGRYQGTRSTLSTVNINPAVAWQPLPWLSLGVGFQAQYARAELANRIDTGASIAASTLYDSAATFRRDDWAFGWTLGALVQPTANWRVGLSWRSQITHNLSGDTEFAVNPVFSGTAVAAALVNRSATGQLALPGTLSVGTAVAVTERVTVLAEFQWQNWSRFNEVRLRFGPPPRADQVSIENYRDSIFVSLGVDWRIDERWSLRAGIALDQTPTRDTYRGVRVADADQVILSVGASARIRPWLTVDVAYAHFFVGDASINKTSTSGDRVTGTAYGDIDEFAVGLRFRF